MKRRWMVMSAALLPVAMFPAVAAPAYAGPVPVSYETVELGTIGGTWALPSAMNNQDEVVGWGDHGTVFHPFLWRAGTMVDLAAAPGSMAGSGVARDVNDRTQVVGTSDTGGFLWDAGVMTPLPGPGSARSTAEAINNHGQVVGSFFPPAGGESHGYLWYRGTVTDLGTIDPVDINDRGEILANRDVEGIGYRACIWRRGQVTDLDFDSAVAINGSGWVTGVTVAPDYSVRAVLWRSGTTTQLGSLGGTGDWPTAINDRGQVLGTSRTANGEVHGVIWQNGRTIDLATRGIVLETVVGQAVPGSLTDINNRGHLVGDLSLPPDWIGPGVLFR